MATLRGKAFIWKGTSWGTGTNGWTPAANATGAGYTGGYWNHADNWYERGEGITDPPEGSSGGGDWDLSNWWKPATRFPRGRDMVIFKRYGDGEYLGISAGPAETLQWGGYTNGVWYGSSGDAGSGATGDPITMSIEASYARTGHGWIPGSTYGSMGYWGPTWGGGSFGGTAATDRQRLMLNCIELRSDWDPGNRRWDSPPKFQLRHSNIASAKLTGLEEKKWYDCTVNKVDINATDLAYTDNTNAEMNRWSAAFIMKRGVINESFTVRGRIPHIILNYTKGTTGGGFDAIRFVNIVGTSPHWNQNPESSPTVELNCNVDELNFWPTRTYTIGDADAPSSGFWETTVGIGPSSATGGITLAGEGRTNIRQLNQGWGYDTGVAAGSSWGCGVWINCGLTLENHIFKSGTISLHRELLANDEVVISDGEIDVNAVVKGIHRTNSQYTGFRIGNFDDATGGYRIVGGSETEYGLNIYLGPIIEFPPGIFVKADYAGYTGGSIPGFGWESGGGK